jgi:hypothetical protein
MKKLWPFEVWHLVLDPILLGRVCRVRFGGTPPPQEAGIPCSSGTSTDSPL